MVSDVAIRVEGLGKEYRLRGSKGSKYKTLRDSLADAAMAPVRMLRGLSGRNGHHTGTESFWALKDVSFEVKRGEVVGVIGRNGAGKSTLLKILSRITEPTTGYADIYGRVGSLLEVGTGFHPELSGRENIYLNGAILGMRRADIDRRFDEIVAFAEVEKFIDTPVKHYSSGMYLRLAFAVAAHLEPEILIVDEVLAVGDAAFQKKCMGKMQDVAGQGRTVLFVSHNMSSIATLTEKCVLLSQGNIICVGDTNQIIRTYLSSSITKRTHEILEENHGDDAFEFLSCKVGSNPDITEFTSDETIDINIVFQVHKQTTGLRVGFDLVNQDGVHLFRTYHDDSNAVPIDLPPGEYQSYCRIPSNLLNSGEYYITLRAGVHAVKRLCILEHFTTFTIVNVTGVNAIYGGSRPGLINPALHWQVSDVKASLK